MNRRKDNATNPASKQYHTLFTLCQIYDLMGHPTGEKQKNEETDEIISNKADYTFQVMNFNCIGYIRIPVVPQLLFKQLHEPSIYYSYWFLSFPFPFISFWISFVIFLIYRHRSYSRKKMFHGPVLLEFWNALAQTSFVIMITTFQVFPLDSFLILQSSFTF